MINLSDHEIQLNLQEFPHWNLVNGQLVREFKFDSFQQSVDFFLLLVSVANDLNHHPDFFNSYNFCRVTLFTHDCNGLSKLDFEFVSRLEDILGD